jgi:hypothetical protein
VTTPELEKHSDMKAFLSRPVRLQITRHKGFNLHELSRSINGLPVVNVSRPGVWGNPFAVDRPGGPGGAIADPADASSSALRAVELYRAMILGENTPDMFPTDARWLHQFRKTFGPNASPREQVRTLAGKNLACWCGNFQPCHADVLLDLANRPGD